MDDDDPIGLSLIIGDVMALRLLMQRLYGLLAVATRHDNEWLEVQRREAISAINSASLTVPDSEAIKSRAESTINALFDGLRLQGAPEQ